MGRGRENPLLSLQELVAKPLMAVICLSKDPLTSRTLVGLFVSDRDPPRRRCSCRGAECELLVSSVLLKLEHNLN